MKIFLKFYENFEFFLNFFLFFCLFPFCLFIFIFLLCFFTTYIVPIQSQFIFKTLLNNLHLLFSFSIFLDVPFRTSDILCSMTSNMSRDILCTEVSHKGKSCSIFLNQHNFICSKFNKLFNYNINILHIKTTGL